jgi:hypothetical protein
VRGLIYVPMVLIGDDLEVRHVIHNLPFGADPWRRLKKSSSHGAVPVVKAMPAHGDSRGKGTIQLDQRAPLLEEG